MTEPTPMQITLRYELNTPEHITEEMVDAPDNWALMTDAERHEWCMQELREGLYNIVGTSYDWDGVPQ